MNELLTVLLLQPAPLPRLNNRAAPAEEELVEGQFPQEPKRYWPAKLNKTTGVCYDVRCSNLA